MSFLLANFGLYSPFSAGMAGSGKTTLMQRLNSHLHSQKTPPYIVNLDPAVTHMPFTANIDIRDTVDYKEVMKQ
jgi:GTPase SAR1 family protein